MTNDVPRRASHGAEDADADADEDAAAAPPKDKEPSNLKELYESLQRKLHGPNFENSAKTLSFMLDGRAVFGASIDRAENLRTRV